MEIVDEVGSCFENIILDFDQPLMNCHLQVTVENFYELFEIEANVMISEGVNSPGFDWRYSSQVFQLLGGLEDPGWTLTFLIKPHGCDMVPLLFDNQAEGKVMASEHSVGGAILDTCMCAQEDAFVAA